MKSKIKILAETTGHYEDLLGGALMDGDENVITVKEALDAMQLWGEEIAEGIKKGLPYFDKPKNETTPGLMEERIKKLEYLLKAYGEWEADLISDNNLWWPYKENDAIRGKVYDKMLELQARRNELLQPSQESDRDNSKEEDDGAWWELFKDIDESKDYETNIANLKKKYSLNKL